MFRIYLHNVKTKKTNFISTYINIIYHLGTITNILYMNSVDVYMFNT